MSGPKLVDHEPMLDADKEAQCRRDQLAREYAPEMRKLLYAWRKGLGTTRDLNAVTDRLLAKIDGLPGGL